MFGSLISTVRDWKFVVELKYLENSSSPSSWILFAFEENDKESLRDVISTQRSMSETLHVISDEKSPQSWKYEEFTMNGLAYHNGIISLQVWLAFASGGNIKKETTAGSTGDKARVWGKKNDKGFHDESDAIMMSSHV